MFRIDAADTAGTKPARAPLGTPGHFKSGDPQNGVMPTEVTAEWLEATQEEVVAIATLRGDALDKENDGQAAAALFATRALDAPTSSSALTVVTGGPTQRASLGGGGSGNGTTFKAGGGTSIDVAGDGNTLGGERSATVGCDDSTADPSLDNVGDQLGAVGVASRFADVGGSQSSVVASHTAKTRGAQTAVVASNNGGGADPVIVDGEASACLAVTDTTGLAAAENHGLASALVACDRGNIDATSWTIAALGSSNPQSTASSRCAALASVNAKLTNAGRCAIIAADDCEIESGQSAIVGAGDCKVSSAGKSVILASDYVELATIYAVGGGAGGVLVPNGTDQNLTWRMQSGDGELYLHGTVHAGGLDYAETFENLTDGEIPAGTLVARTGAKVRPCKAGDRIVGVISATPAVLGDPASLNWSGKFKRDEWGRVLTDAVPIVTWPELAEVSKIPAVLDDKGKELTPECNVRTVTRQGYTGRLENAPQPVPGDARHASIDLGQVSADFDDAAPYTPRQARPSQWSVVGLVGQLLVRVSADVADGDDLAAGDGGLGVPTSAKAAPRGAQLEVMTIASPFDAERGYAIALCLVR